MIRERRSFAVEGGGRMDGWMSLFCDIQEILEAAVVEEKAALPLSN